MGFHSIKVDDEVMEFLKKNAIPFEDTPNDVIRRLLKMNIEQNVRQGSNVEQSFPTGLPAALEQIFEVYQQVAQNGVDRKTATNIVARRRNIAPQTVQDKYARQLGKTAFEVDGLMHPSNASEFESHLKDTFPRYTSEIEIFFVKMKGGK